MEVEGEGEGVVEVWGVWKERVFSLGFVAVDSLGFVEVSEWGEEVMVEWKQFGGKWLLISFWTFSYL